MSVQCFTQIEIKELLGMVKFHEEILMKAITENLNLHIIPKTLKMAFIANRVAYAVQYKESTIFDDMIINLNKNYALREIDPIKCSKNALYENLSHLLYNLFTNDGDIFLPDQYTQAIQKMLQCLQ